MTAALTLDPGFSTAPLASVFSDVARVAAMCRFEASLARASSRANLVPAPVADRIVAVCRTGVGDPDKVLAEGWEVGTPVLPLLDRLRARLERDDAAWLHHGATTQDVIDTAMVLQTKDALVVLRVDLLAVALRLRMLAVDHRSSPAAAWTLLQPAVPTTMGRRMAGWLSPVVGHLTSLRELAVDLPLQFGGPTGTLHGLGESALDVADGLAADLGLSLPDVPWHTDRTPVTSMMDALGRLARTVRSIAMDSILLAHQGAVSMRAGTSSSMSWKRNPIDSVRALAAAEACAGAVSIVSRGGPHELERGVGGWHVEWLAVPLAFHTVGAAVEALRRAVESLTVIEDPPEAGRTPATDAFVDRVVRSCDLETSL